MIVAESRFRRRGCPRFTLIGVLMFAVVVGSPRASATAPGVSEREIIEATLPADILYDHSARSLFELGHSSPDGRWITVALKQSSVRDDTTRFSLVMWRVDPSSHRVGIPDVAVTMTSSDNLPILRQIRWSADSQRVTFIGKLDGSPQQVFEYNLITRQVRRLTEHSTNVVSYSINDRGDIAFLGEKAAHSLWDEQSLRSGLPLGDRPDLTMPDVLLGVEGSDQIFDRPATIATELFFQRHNGSEQHLPTLRPTQTALGAALSQSLALSPNGEYVAVLTDVSRSDIDSAWQSLGDPSIENAFQYNTNERNIEINGRPVRDRSYINHYELISVQAQRAKVLRNDPISSAGLLDAQPIWSPTGTSIFVRGLLQRRDATTPIDDGNGQGWTELTTEGSIVSSLRGCNKLDRWGLDGSETVTCRGLSSRPDSSGAADLNRPREIPVTANLLRSGRSWKEKSKVPSTTIVVRESAWSAPKLFVQYGNGRSANLMDLNPWLHFRSIPKIEDISIYLPNGQQATGGLYYPIGYVPGTRYPLVIQSHGWNSARWWPDGFATTGYAAFALATKGFFVLQVNDLSPDTNMPPEEEMDRAVRIYESAVTSLGARGLIDPAKVGILGFSRTSDYLTWALTRRPSLFAAAAVCEGTGGYYSYISRLGAGSMDVAQLYGGAPVSRSFQRWIEIEPSFNLNMVETPLRISVVSSSLYLGLDWEWFVQLRHLHHPVDLVALPKGDHIITRPSERLVVSGGNVDWFDFWLRHHEDPNPSKVAQYNRWRHLRDH